MSKHVKFKKEYEKDSFRIKYPDERDLFSNTVEVDGFIHAYYSGNKRLTKSTHFLEIEQKRVISEVKSVAFHIIKSLDGVEGWKRQKAQEYSKFKGDDSLLLELFNQAEDIRKKSNKVEEAILKMSYEELLDLDVVGLLK